MTSNNQQQNNRTLTLEDIIDYRIIYIQRVPASSDGCENANEGTDKVIMFDNESARKILSQGKIDTLPEGYVDSTIVSPINTDINNIESHSKSKSVTTACTISTQTESHLFDHYDTSIKFKNIPLDHKTIELENNCEIDIINTSIHNKNSKCDIPESLNVGIPEHHLDYDNDSTITSKALNSCTEENDAKDSSSISYNNPKNTNTNQVSSNCENIVNDQLVQDKSKIISNDGNYVNENSSLNENDVKEICLENSQISIDNDECEQNKKESNNENNTNENCSETICSSTDDIHITNLKKVSPPLILENKQDVNVRNNDQNIPMEDSRVIHDSENGAKRINIETYSNDSVQSQIAHPEPMFHENVTSADHEHDHENINRSMSTKTSHEPNFTILDQEDKSHSSDKENKLHEKDDIIEIDSGSDDDNNIQQPPNGQYSGFKSSYDDNNIDHTLKNQHHIDIIDSDGSDVQKQDYIEIIDDSDNDSDQVDDIGSSKIIDEKNNSRTDVPMHNNLFSSPWFKIPDPTFVHVPFNTRKSKKRKISRIVKPAHTSFFQDKDQQKKPPHQKKYSNVEKNDPLRLNKALLDEQERLFRESKARVQAQAEIRRNFLREKEKLEFFTKPVNDLTTLPNIHWKWSDPYSRLGLPQNANFELVKKHYRKLCLLYHPDKARCDSVENSDRFQAIKEAYESISQGI